MYREQSKSATCCGLDHHDEATAIRGSGKASLDVLGRGVRSGSRGEKALGHVDQPRIQRAVREILAAIGEDPDRDGLQDTPARVARAYAEIFGGLHQSAAPHLARVFAQEGPSEVVICRDIEFASMCEHHLLPFVGKAHIAYQPNGTDIVGLSKLARTVDVFARRPQVQERLTNEIADAIDEHLQPLGVLIVIESEHFCMKMRGVGKQGSTMVTTAGRGVLAEVGPFRAEVMSLMMNRSV